jgi:hypothetical protein
MPPDLWRSRPGRAVPAHRRALTLVLTSLLAACAATSPAPVIDRPAPPVTPAVTAPIAPPAPPAAAAQTDPAWLATSTTPSGAVQVLANALAYAERLRTLSPAELTAEQAQIGEPGSSPERLMQLALVLSQTHAPADTARALGLLQRLTALNAPEAVELRPLARLLAGRLLEARRLEDQADRQAQQLREAQRRIEVLNDRLEAMRAIERSLTPRAPAPGGARPMP